jgi:hypothetical protein
VRADGFAGGFLLPKKYNMLEIKKEFKKLIPPLTAEEFKQLEENCLNEGIREFILTWNGFIIDGHNRYEIATKWNLDYQTKSKHFASEQDVIEWMILNQLGRRNITKEQKDYLIGKRYENEKQKQGTRNDLTLEQNVPLISTAEKIAEEVGISHMQVKRNEEFAKGVDKLGEELKQQVLQGKAEVNKSDVQAIAKAEPTFVAQTEADIIAKAKEIKERKAEEYKQKIVARVESKVNENPMSFEERDMLDKIEKGETVVINMNVHFHVLKYAKDKGIYQQIDRYSEWGNPFFLNSDGDRDEVCDGYIEYLKHKRSLHTKIIDLKGKVLGCHCAPLRCHGDHLKTLSNEN